VRIPEPSDLLSGEWIGCDRFEAYALALVPTNAFGIITRVVVETEKPSVTTRATALSNQGEERGHTVRKSWVPVTLCSIQQLLRVTESNDPPSLNERSQTFVHGSPVGPTYLPISGGRKLVRFLGLLAQFRQKPERGASAAAAGTERPPPSNPRHPPTDP